MRRAPGIITLLAFALAAIVLPVYAAKVAHKTDYTDFEVYHRSAVRALQHVWGRVYDLGDGSSPYRYAPPTLPLFRPFAGLSLATARLLWFFLQYGFFGAGFFFLHRALKLIDPRRALWVTCFSMLFVLRFCLDTFTIGQISSLMFLGYCLSAYGWLEGSSGLAGTGLFIPSLFKIGPGVGYPLFLIDRHPRARPLRALTGPLFWTALLSGLCLAWTRSWETFRGLWDSWLLIVSKDSAYYDASHYGSQSLKSAILRLVKSGLLPMKAGLEIYFFAAAMGTLGLFSFWLFRSPRTLRGRGLFFALAIFPYLWFMPETFKYALTTLAIPVAFLLASPLPRWTDRAALIFGALTLSLAGKDLLPDSVFFGLQQSSVPFLATLALAAVTLRLAWEESAPSYLPLRSLGPWTGTPAARADLEATLLLPLPPGITRAEESEVACQVIQDARPALARLFGESYEILPLPASEGRAAALREGFLRSRGKILLTAHAQQPCEPSFYPQAVARLAEGFDLVRANRRHPESRFKIPVRELPVVYGRHRLGMLFNRIVRALLPLQSTDTLSGTCAMTRRMATAAFAVQSSPDFLFDIELGLAAIGHGYRESDLPVTLYLAQEKTPERVFGEMLLILQGLPLLVSRFRQGYYSKARAPRHMTADDWGLSPAVNRGILELARKGVIHRVSMMANCPYLEEGLTELKQVPGVELGLHFNLTYGPEAAGQRPRTLFWHWVNPFGDRAPWAARARSALDAQLARLASVGVKPVYLDGHHHIHLVPGLIDALAPRIREAGIRDVRLPYDPALWLTAKLPLNVLSVLARGSLRRHDFRYKPVFYPPISHFLDQGRLRAELARNAEAEIIVHPAEREDVSSLEYPDSYTVGRVTEYQALRMLGPFGRDAESEASR